MSTGALFHNEMFKNQPVLACLIGNIGARAQLMATFSGFYESHEPPPSGNVHGLVLPQCDGHRNGQQSWYILCHRFVDCCPGGSQGNTKHLVPQ